MPRIEDILDRMNRVKFFSVFVLKSGYHQIQMLEEDVPKTEFSFERDHFQLGVLQVCFKNLWTKCWKDSMKISAKFTRTTLLFLVKTNRPTKKDLNQLFERLWLYGLISERNTWVTLFLKEGLEPIPKKQKLLKNASTQNSERSWG